VVFARVPAKPCPLYSADDARQQGAGSCSIGANPALSSRRMRSHRGHCIFGTEMGFKDVEFAQAASMDRPMTVKEMARTTAGAVTSLVIVGWAVFLAIAFLSAR
jgi:hypothetical protein